MIIDLHIHTKPASACSSLDPIELFQEAKRIGLDGICLTEHDKLWDSQEVARLRKEYDLVILRGVEVTSMEGDILVFGLKDELNGIISLEKLREVVDETGGVMLASHPFRGGFIAGKEFTIPGLTLTVENACKEHVFQFVEGMEVLNGENSDIENEFAVEVCQQLSLRGVGGSDAHNVSEVGRCVTIFEQKISTEEELIQELKAGQFRVEKFRC
jgi:hypothetical protein